MRVATYSTNLSRSAGGLYYSVSGLSKAIAGLGHDVAVFGGADEHFEEDRSIWGDLDLHAYPLRFGGYGFDPQILSDIMAFKPDLLHIHGIWSGASIYGRYAVFRDIPVVISPRGMLDPWILARKPLVKKLHAAVLERPMMDKAYLNALNESERRSIVAYMPEVAQRTFVIPNGIPAAETPHSDIERRGTLFIGRLHSKKQTLELIDIWKATAALSSVDLTVAGWGDEEYENEVRARAGHAANVTFVGSLYGEEKAAAMRSTKFFILPSLSEGLPMAVLEALQYGAIPIITDECNLPELFENKVAIRIEKDFSDFEQVVGQAMAMDEASVRELSNRAMAFSERYAWNTIAERMVDQYETILAA